SRSVPDHATPDHTRLSGVLQITNFRLILFPPSNPSTTQLGRFTLFPASRCNFGIHGDQSIFFGNQMYSTAFGFGPNIGSWQAPRLAPLMPHHMMRIETKFH